MEGVKRIFELILAAGLAGIILGVAIVVLIGALVFAVFLTAGLIQAILIGGTLCAASYWFYDRLKVRVVARRGRFGDPRDRQE